MATAVQKDILAHKDNFAQSEDRGQPLRPPSILKKLRQGKETAGALLVKAALAFGCVFTLNLV